MSQTPSILLERDKSQLEPMASRRLRFASDGQLELNMIGVNDAVFDVPPVRSGGGGAEACSKSYSAGLASRR